MPRSTSGVTATGHIEQHCTTHENASSFSVMPCEDSMMAAAARRDVPRSATGIDRRSEASWAVSLVITDRMLGRLPGASVSVFSCSCLLSRIHKCHTGCRSVTKSLLCLVNHGSEPGSALATSNQEC